MKKFLSIVIITGVFSSCGNRTESSAGSDTTNSDTTNSITSPPTSDTAGAMAPMMGDTSKTDADSLKK